VELILHIGDGKCGSTAIQQSLYDAADTLAEAGVLYVSERRRGAYDFSVLLGRETRGDVTRETKAAKNNLDTIVARAAAERPAFVLISSEYLFSRPPARLLELLTANGLKPVGIHVFAYVRRPADMFVSLLQQSMKADHRGMDPAQFRRDVSRPLAAWGAAPECLSVCVGLFDRTRLKDNSVVADFADAIGLITGQAAITLPDADANVSLSVEQVLALRDFRAAFCADTPGRYRAESNRLLRLFEQMNARFGRVGSPVRLDDNARALIALKHQDVIDRMRKMAPWCDLAEPDADRLKAPKGELSADPSDLLIEWNSDVLAALKSLAPEFRDMRPLRDIAAVLNVPEDELQRIHAELFRPDSMERSA